MNLYSERNQNLNKLKEKLRNSSTNRYVDAAGR